MAPAAVYVPPPGLHTALDDFRDHLSRKYHVTLTNYNDLHTFSVTRLNDFWMAAIDERIPINQFPRFFVHAHLNFAENMLKRRKQGTAVIEVTEGRLADPKIFSWQDLEELVRLYADALKISGLKRGQVVAVVGSNCVRSLALLLATGALGAIFSSFATDIGEQALKDRLEVLRPRIFFAESKYSYNGKENDISRTIANCSTMLKSVTECELIVIGAFSCPQQSTSFETFLRRETGAQLVYEQVPFSTPLVVMFSSGTTGMPKGIVHSHGGLVINGVKEHMLHNNIGPEDVHFHFSGIGWTLWNISIGCLFSGSTLVLYDGSPFYPTPEGFLRGIFSHKITSFGAGPRYYSELQKHGLKPKTFTPYLHTLISTGAVLPVPLASWLAEAFGPVCQIGMSGGTELCGSFLHGTRSLPAYPGEIAVKALGMDVAVYSPSGTVLPEGQSGELVCTKPFPNMPVMLLNDPDRTRYFSSYFKKFPNVWTHGDFIQINPETQGIYVLGRSDGVLNPSGIRFGSSEIYRILATPKFTSFISDACVVGQQRVKPPFCDPAERVILFIKCTPAATTKTLQPNSDLEKQIRQQIARDLSRRHVPTYIFEVPEIPHNSNGKKLELQIKSMVCDGKEAVSKLKGSKEEIKSISSFEKFYHIEKLIDQHSRGSSKL